MLPTALRSIVRTRAPPVPAGIARCDDDTTARWAADSYRFPPYQYQERFLFWPDDQWRLANSGEKELLLGGPGHTKLCWSASQIKDAPQQYEDERLSLLGDSFSVASFIIPAAALCWHFIPQVSYQHLVNRLGLAPGFLCPLRWVASISRELCYGLWNKGVPHSVHELNRVLLSRTNHTGSDVKSTTGVSQPQSCRETKLEATWWKWTPAFSFQWRLAPTYQSVGVASHPAGGKIFYFPSEVLATPHFSFNR